MALAQQSALSEIDKKAAIKDLLNAIDANKIVAAIGEGAKQQSKQMVPAILEQALIEDKVMTDQQKKDSVPRLQQDVIPKLVDQAGKVFSSDGFKNDAIQAQYTAYGKFYTTDEIKALTAFYKSSVGQKYIKVQDQVGQEVMGNLMQKYMPQAVKATRDIASKDVANIGKTGTWKDFGKK